MQWLAGMLGAGGIKALTSINEGSVSVRRAGLPVSAVNLFARDHIGARSMNVREVSDGPDEGYESGVANSGDRPNRFRST